MAEHDPYGRRDTEVFPQGTTGSSATSAVDESGRRRDVDNGALVAGVLFILVAILLMAGVDLSFDWFGNGIAWVILIGAGTALLVNEWRKARRRG
ncbi:MULTISPECIES: hypothetical protein [unclassified Modestobacter]|uniref:hypothetical protein n=1 Tax=unclassified Modestobacter TaxID=2643866 RepID=UPI0022AA0E70|nr:MULTISPECIES: hypothetical protein [unclassified Modestobacter]MCZ2823681.1 hypothetical protein [Modestobacter sp. VKM Ac-2981]MCZ2851926.1 hypothetical protein [Modestobacter sp. VKM Ac-2982]